LLPNLRVIRQVPGLWAFFFFAGASCAPRAAEMTPPLLLRTVRRTLVGLRDLLLNGGGRRRGVTLYTTGSWGWKSLMHNLTSGRGSYSSIPRANCLRSRGVLLDLMGVWLRRASLRAAGMENSGPSPRVRRRHSSSARTPVGSRHRSPKSAVGQAGHFDFMGVHLRVSHLLCAEGDGKVSSTPAGAEEALVRSANARGVQAPVARSAIAQSRSLTLMDVQLHGGFLCAEGWWKGLIRSPGCKGGHRPGRGRPRGSGTGCICQVCGWRGKSLNLMGVGLQVIDLPCT
jgi:hypothetical protein